MLDDERWKFLTTALASKQETAFHWQRRKVRIIINDLLFTSAQVIDEAANFESKGYR